MSVKVDTQTKKVLVDPDSLEVLCCPGCPCQPSEVDCSYSGTTPFLPPCHSFSYSDTFMIGDLDPDLNCEDVFFGTVHNIVCDEFTTLQIQLTLGFFYDTGTGQWKFTFQLNIFNGIVTEVGTLEYDFDCPPQTVNDNFGAWTPFVGYTGHLDATIT